MYENQKTKYHYMSGIFQGAYLCNDKRKVTLDSFGKAQTEKNKKKSSQTVLKGAKTKLSFKTCDIL